MDQELQGRAQLARPALVAAATSPANSSRLMAGVKAEHIPYKGAGPAGGPRPLPASTTSSFSGLQGSQVQVRAGRLRAIAVTTPKRLPSNPELPAMAEVLPGFEVVGWYGVIGPANMRPLVEKLHGRLVKILNQARRRRAASKPTGRSPWELTEEFGFMHADLNKWAKLVEAARSWNEAFRLQVQFGAGGPARAPRARPAA